MEKTQSNSTEMVLTNNRYHSHSVEGIFVFVFCLVLMIVVATNKIPSNK